MGGNESKKEFIGEEIICPKCPLTPIISIFLNPEGILTCEYRCSFMHFGQIPFEDISKDKENKHGKFCDRCVNSKGKDEKNNAIKGFQNGELVLLIYYQFLSNKQEYNIYK